MSDMVVITSGDNPNSWSETVAQARFRWLVRSEGSAPVLQQAHTVTRYEANKAVSRHEDWVDVETVVDFS